MNLALGQTPRKLSEVEVLKMFNPIFRVAHLKTAKHLNQPIPAAQK